MADIGYQDGLSGFVAWVRKTDPTVKYRPADKRPKSPSEWFWLEKFEDRLLRHLKDEHDAESVAEPSDPPPPPPPPPPPTTYKKVAPRVAYKQGGSDARYCVVNQPGVYWDANYYGGRWRDDVASYDRDGLCWGGRSDGPALTGALEINGREYCSLPTFGDPTKNTGSWAI